MSILLYAVLSLQLLCSAWPGAQYSQDRWDPFYDDRNYNESRRLSDVADRLATAAASLWAMVRNSPEFRQPGRRYIHELIRDFERNARLYRSNPSEWRARQLINQAGNISRFVDNTELPYEFRNNWFELEDQVAQIGRYHGLSLDRGRRLARTDPYGAERGFRWSGRVDGADIIYLRGDRVQYRHLRAEPIRNASVDIRTALPRRAVDVRLRKIQGRGSVRIVQQPTEANNYTAGVMIEDDQAGADFYEFELLW
ncbi:MAG: hypothetical protein GXX84_10070 [Acidobacteria bacterium]|nr:hypothetical protein [Acidobacteriota bacterium]